MTNTATAQIDPYTLLRASLALFGQLPAQLDAAQLQQARVQAVREYALEARVLASTEAAKVIISAQEVENAYRQIRERYDSEGELLADLHQNDLDVDRLQQALQRECRVNATLAWVGSRAPAISDVDIGIYYHAHPEKFVRPERREVRHILITINDTYAENSRANALARMTGIAAKLARKPYKFAELAMQYSECPSALQGGLLGTVARGTLYPELDAALFQMQPGEIGTIIETEIGLHILLCVNIERSESISLKNAAPKIRQLLQERSQRVCQRTWLANLAKSSRKEAPYESAA